MSNASVPAAGVVAACAGCAALASVVTCPEPSCSHPCSQHQQPAPGQQPPGGQAARERAAAFAQCEVDADGLSLKSPINVTKRPDPYDPSPRRSYLSWDDYFMAVAFLSAERSKDPNKQVGACIVDADQVIVGIGYNGMPRGCPDTRLPWAKRSRRHDPLDTKYPYVVHAEANALLNKNAAHVHGARIYVTMMPCNECAKLLIQAGIREVVYHEAKLEARHGGAAAALPPRGRGSCTRGAEANGDLLVPGAGEDAAGGVAAMQAAADVGYVASQRLLNLAGVKLRQHALRAPIVLGRPLATATGYGG